MPDYVELQATSNSSFLCDASHVEELLLQINAMSYEAIGITDHDTLAGIARAHARALVSEFGWSSAAVRTRSSMIALLEAL